jgi:hypothetical protein
MLLEPVPPVAKELSPVVDEKLALPKVGHAVLEDVTKKVLLEESPVEAVGAAFNASKLTLVDKTGELMLADETSELMVVDETSKLVAVDETLLNRDVRLEAVVMTPLVNVVF